MLLSLSDFEFSQLNSLQKELIAQENPMYKLKNVEILWNKLFYEGEIQVSWTVLRLFSEVAAPLNDKEVEDQLKVFLKKSKCIKNFDYRRVKDETAYKYWINIRGLMKIIEPLETIKAKNLYKLIISLNEMLKSETRVSNELDEFLNDSDSSSEDAPTSVQAPVPAPTIAAEKSSSKKAVPTVPEGHRACVECSSIKPIDEFKTVAKGHSKRCISCFKKHATELTSQRREKERQKAAKEEDKDGDLWKCLKCKKIKDATKIKGKVCVFCWTDICRNNKIQTEKFQCISCVQEKLAQEFAKYSESTYRNICKACFNEKRRTKASV